MVEVEFIFNQQKFIIQAKLDDLFQSVIDKFVQKINAPKNAIYLANGNVIDPNKTVESQMNDNYKKDKKIPVVVREEVQDNQLGFVKSKDIICPTCKEPCLFKIEKCQIKLFDCINNHTTKGMKFKDFYESQKKDISKIICDECKNQNKGKSFSQKFYFCLTCKKNICPLCNINHNKNNKNHVQIDYDEKNYICPKHNDNFNKYCPTCHLNLCFSCGHNQHQITELKSVDIKQTKKILKEMEKEIRTLNDDIKKIINKLNKFMESIQMYYEINKNIVENFDISNKKRNFQVLNNINEINSNNEIFIRLKNINKNINIIGKIREIFDLDFEMNKDNIDNEINLKQENNLNHIIMIHNIKNKGKIRIFGDNFVKNNKNKNNCYLKVNGEIKQLCVYLELNDNEKDTLEIKLIENQPINDMSYIFFESETLKYINFKWKMNNITNISFMFCKCTSLVSIEGISLWNTTNITDMSYLFSSCKYLKILPDISNWNVQNVTDMSYMFNDCRSLKALPDLSKWKINKTLDKEGMFDGVDKNIIPKKFKSCLIY